MVEGKKVLGASPNLYGHTIPVLKLSTELQKLGNQSTMITFGNLFDDLMKHYGVVTKPMSRYLTMQKRILNMKSVLNDLKPEITINDWCFDFWFAVWDKKQQRASFLSKFSKKDWQPKCRISILRSDYIMGIPRINFLMPDKYGLENGSWNVHTNNTFRDMKMGPITNGLDITNAEVIVIPSIPAIDPLPEKVNDFYPNAQFVYTGTLLLPLDEPVSPDLQEWLLARRNDGIPIVLITLGTVWGNSIYTLLAECFENSQFAVVMIVQGKEERDLLKQKNGPRFYVTPTVDLLELTRQVDVVIHHSGQATSHTVILAGKPSVSITSGEFDREDNAIRLENLNCLRHLDHGFFKKGFQPKEIQNVVNQVLHDSTIQAGVAAVSQSLREYVDKKGIQNFIEAVANRVS